jgi:glyoxylase-like metal-dependent hydrolase (beta-lactamase superfamily II)
VLIAGFPAGAWGTNCYVVAPAAGEQCVVIDPGQDAAPGVDEVVREHRLQPVAVLLTHGHLDHVWSVVPVCGAHDVPAYIHPADRDLLTDPGKGLGLPAGHPLFGGLTWSEPDDVREIGDGCALQLAGLDITVDLAPGHTPGSITFRVAGDADVPAAELLFSGDLLFAGSVGRTDLPGGDQDALLDSLARVCLPLPDETPVLSGHGSQTTIGRERASNPWLRAVAEAGDRGAAGRSPARGW